MNAPYFAEFLSGIPYLAIVAILLHYFLRRAIWKRRTRKGRIAGFCPSASAMGAILLFAQTFYRPSVSWLIEAKEVQPADEDDDGDPETPAKHLNRQLRRIRRGEPLDTLTLRL